MDAPIKCKVAEFDCTKEYSPEEYFACGDVKVVKGGAGRYREAEARPLSRFGYRFAIEHVGRPHVAVIRYPDDKRRFMVINDGTCYDLSTGIYTGFTTPISGTMQTIHQVFWPRWKDCSIAFMTWGHGEPAAIESIEVYELEELPALALTALQKRRDRRQFGIQYEDPCGTGASEGAMTFETWLDRMVDYAQHTGQKMLAYPICWYHGPCFNSEREPSDCFSVVVAEDRRQYTAWTSEPPDWPATILKRFEQEGLEFQGVLTLLRLGSLMGKMNIDLEAIKGGAETINNMLSNDQVQAGTMDWTTVYNTKVYDALVPQYEKVCGDLSGFEWAYGEKRCQPYHGGPMFNPLHPVVQEAIVGFIDEIARRYGKSPAFKGVAITMWVPTIIWFGSVHSGYDDYTVGLFEQETGIKVDVDGKAADRFSKRYEWLMFYCREAWLDWRCRKIKALIGRMRDALTAQRKDLRLTLNCWSETLGIAWGRDRAFHQIYARRSLRQIYREAGLDLEMYREEDGIEFDVQFEGGGRDRTQSEFENYTLEMNCGFKDFDFLDRDTLGSLAEQRKPGVLIFNAWHEAWGKHKWFACGEDDEQADRLAYTYGKKAEGMFRMNSEYPPDGFWWDSQLRITPAFPPEVHFMEPYAHAMAELDACRITRGGLFLEKAHSDQLRRFARAYRALPDAKFETVGGTTDPVAVRTLVHGGRRYVYLVNREYYPVEVEVAFSGSPKELTDLSDGKALRAGKKWNLVLEPYQLLSVGLDPAVEPVGFSVKVADRIVKSLRAEAKKALKAIEAVARSGRLVTGMDRMAREIGEALEQGRYAWLRHALVSYVVLKCRELAEKA
ncbi:MAG: hypothetical protein GXY33_16660 [Phycisphaerae bacterium]|nr:hypothetical protein [Phycisphaerae bacterium]